MGRTRATQIQIRTEKDDTYAASRGKKEGENVNRAAPTKARSLNWTPMPMLDLSVEDIKRIVVALTVQGNHLERGASTVVIKEKAKEYLELGQRFDEAYHASKFMTKDGSITMKMGLGLEYPGKFTLAHTLTEVALAK